MKITISTPTKAFVDCTPNELHDLRKALTYTNTSVAHQVKRHGQNFWWKNRNLDTWQYHMDELRKDLKKCLVFEEDGRNYIRPGSIPYLTGFELEVENSVVYPKSKPIPWLKPLPFKLHPEQEESCSKLTEILHGNVSLCTGFGKTAAILKLCRDFGLKTVVMVPSKSIFEELLEKLEFHFGKKYIGTFGAGKKKLGKLITLCIGDSLTNVEPETEEWSFFGDTQLFIADESHDTAAETLEKVCHGVLSNSPYRFFFSATQLRNDGSGPLLQSIIGKTVCSLTTAEAVKKGYICDHDFRIVAVESSNPSVDQADPLAQKREHFLKNRNIANFTAKLANAMASIDKGTLVLVEELSQISMLVPLLKYPYAIAHSEKRKERLLELGIEKVDNKESVEKFNRGEVKILIGTSCIATGTNIFPCHNLVNWVGGASPIRTKQGAVGRGVRHGHSNPWASNWIEKKKCTIYDFDVEDHPTMTRHLEARMVCYKESETSIKYLRLK